MWIAKNKDYKNELRVFKNKPTLHENCRLKKFNPHLEEDIPANEWWWVDEIIDPRLDCLGITIPNDFIDGVTFENSPIEVNIITV